MTIEKLSRDGFMTARGQTGIKAGAIFYKSQAYREL
jgi:hypothetical protein